MIIFKFAIISHPPKFQVMLASFIKQSLRKSQIRISHYRISLLECFIVWQYLMHKYSAYPCHKVDMTIAVLTKAKKANL